MAFGKAPEVVNLASVKDLVDLSPFAIQYTRVLDLAQRAKEQQQLHDPVLPGFFLTWAKRNDIDYPTELEEQVRMRGQQVADWKSLYDEQASVLADLKRQCDRIKAEYDETQTLLVAKEIELAELTQERNNLSVEAVSAKHKSSATKERDSLLKLVIGMAVKGYAYDPKATRSEVPNEMVHDFKLLGISINAGTVRKYLQEATDLLPGENLDDQDC